MSFVRNFALGQQIAQTALDTYETAREKRRLRDISEAKPTEIENAYTTQDAEQLRALANAKDAQGNPYYNLQANPDGSYGLKTNFEYQGQDGQMVQPGGVATTFAPRSSVVEFMGTRYAPEDLNEDRIAGIRARAMADVVAERDPVRGLQLRQSIKASERDDIRFGWERDQQPLKQKQLEQSVRGGEINLGQMERQLLVQQAEDAAVNMPEDQVRLALTEYLNTNKSDLPLFVLGKTKDGFIMAERDPQTGVLGEQFQVPLAVGRKLVVGRQLAEKGFGKEALQYLSGVDDNINAIIDRYTKTMLDVARFNNDVEQARFGRAMDEARLGLDRERLGLQRRETDARINAAGRPNFQMIGTDERGEPVWVDMNRLGSGEDGRMRLPAGVTPMRLPQSLSDAEKIAYERAIEQVAMLPPDAPPGAAADIFRRFGLDPQRFTGNAGLPTSPRFGGGTNPPAANTPAPAPAPAPRPLTGFEQRRQQALEEEAARRAREREARQRESEAERLRRLEARPDLQGIGGLRYFQ